MKHLSVLALTIALTLSAYRSAIAGYHDDDRVGNPAAAVADVVLVRPVLLGVSLATTAFYLATVPLTFLIDADEEAGDVLVHCPWWYTSGRDLGRFDQPRP